VNDKPPTSPRAPSTNSSHHNSNQLMNATKIYPKILYP
jgi:hypothetical protein